MILLVGIILIVWIIVRCSFKFKTRKSSEIYNIVWAHRGFHMCHPENSLKAYKAGIKMGCGIELDIRQLKDGNIVCFHDRYMKRLLNVPGKLCAHRYDTIQGYTLLDSRERVPLFSDALKLLAKQTPILVELKGWISKKYRLTLIDTINKYSAEESKIYFHTKNLIDYYILKKVYGKKVFLVCNVFRKRFDFLKGGDYSENVKSFDRVVNNPEYFKTNELELPTLSDISAMIVDAVEENESLNGIIKKIRNVFNVYTTRIKKDHWINKSLLIHRGALTAQSYENSISSIIECIEFAKSNQIRIAVEIDVVQCEGKIKCYHNDKPGRLIGQGNALAIKNDLKTACTLEDVINTIKGNEEFISLILDIKDYRIRNRSLEVQISKIIEDSHFAGNFAVQSFNPCAISYFKKNHPSYIRGQVGHSLRGIFKNLDMINVWLVNVFFFDASLADYCVYDDSNYIWLLLKYNKDLKGRPALIYAPKSEKEVRAYIGRQCISNYIVENVGRHKKRSIVLNEKSWSKDFIEQYKIKEKE